MWRYALVSVIIVGLLGFIIVVLATQQEQRWTEITKGTIGVSGGDIPNLEAADDKPLSVPELNRIVALRPLPPPPEVDSKADEIASQLAALDVRTIGSLGKGVATDPVLGGSNKPVGLLDDAGRSGLTHKVKVTFKLRGHKGIKNAKRTIKRLRKRLAVCYRAALVLDPAIAGKVTISFTVKPDGTVHIPNPKAAIKHTEVPGTSSCILNVLSDAAFARPKSGSNTVLRLALRFRQKK